MKKKYFLNKKLTINDFALLCEGDFDLVLSEKDKNNITRSEKRVSEIISKGEIVYGINTGFGGLSDRVIDLKSLVELQENLLRSSACNVGEPIDEKISRGIILLLINSLVKGYSGVSLKTVEVLIKLFNSGLVPFIPSKGSVGASGDLSPLSHLALILLGEGFAFDGKKKISGKMALAKIGCNSIKLKPKEGLALINGTHVMASYATWAIWKAEKLVDLANKAGALSMEALRANDAFLDKRIHALKNHPGQINVAEKIREMIKGSRLINSMNDKKVQDAYCLRCMPQVHGAALDLLDYAKKVVEREINAVTDNPLIFDDSQAISGGNFHGQALAFAMDSLAMAVSELADISERRTNRLLDEKLNGGLPGFLINGNGVNCGFMVLQYTAAALVSENKVLGHPACLDSIPTSASQEDHVSMGSISSKKIHNIITNIENVLAIEFLSATQAIDFLQPSKMSKGTRKIYGKIRSIVSYAEKDRVFAYDIENVCSLIKIGKI